MRKTLVFGAFGIAVLGFGAAAVSQVVRRPPVNITINDATRIALLQQQVTTLNTEVKALTARADQALYVQKPSKGVCRQGGTLSPTDILTRGRTYAAAIKKSQEDYPLGYVLPTIQCLAQ